MRDFEVGAIVRVPFPYTDRETRQRRPALVISNGGIGQDRALLWVLMITSAENRRWPGDVSIENDHERCGLPVPSLVRTAKIATIERTVTQALGMLDAERLAQVRDAVAQHFGTASL